MVVSVCEILVPDPPEPPEVPDDVTVQVKVVPATLLVKGIEVVLPEHIVDVAGVAVATGFGLTVIVIVSGVPGQAFAIGVTL